MQNNFELILFSTDIDYIQQSVAAGVDAIIVDWERRGKIARQLGANTQINHDTLEDLYQVCASTSAKILCRINSFGVDTKQEIEAAIDAGVAEILLPMVSNAHEVITVLQQVRSRCGVGILIETNSAIAIANQLAQLPLSRVYVGLNDLAIERGSPSIFNAILDGTVERLRQTFTVPFGFAGLTLIDKGYPIACRLLVAELMRLECQFSFLRRSFLIDSNNLDLTESINNLRNAINQASQRSKQLVAYHHRELCDAIQFAIEQGEGLLFKDVVK